ncbi:MAG: DUF1622 domain-containing protein [Pleurocapsa sp. SU_5_0]|jgi:uncharacterized membrane protein|nr:DUF1622 domain-containing protein [Pleurocapsa sp. SU_5_0]NJO94838.1 DUF1622 domain-containing protein [Pleurocapsa sp. CRU_1_2]NJR44861.1 DUF1622 domain-containing protein [Hyellaceae cyanobacterium CSU_1_1]
MFVQIVSTLNDWVVSLCQLLALFVIVIGIAKALIIYSRHIFTSYSSAIAFQGSRLELGYGFSLGLSFLLGGSILKTTITPSWNELGQLAAIIALRTILNYLLLQAIDKNAEDSKIQSLWFNKHQNVA